MRRFRMCAVNWAGPTPGVVKGKKKEHISIKGHYKCDVSECVP